MQRILVGWFRFGHWVRRLDAAEWPGSDRAVAVRTRRVPVPGCPGARALRRAGHYAAQPCGSYWSDLRMPLVTAGMQRARRRRRAGRDPARVGRLHAAHRRTRRKNGRIGAMSSIAPLASLGLLAWYAGLPARRLLSEPSQRGFVNVR